MHDSSSGADSTGLAPVVDDLSIYLIAGRVTTETKPGFTNVKTALTDAVDAERLGFRRGWLSERFDLKDAGAILGGIAARTSRFGVGTGVWATPSRHPMIAASFGATMNALYGPRFTLGLGRGVPLPDMPEHSYAEFVHYAETVKRLWAGGEVDYTSGGRATTLRTIDALGEVPKPEIWTCNYGRPRSAKAAANDVFDGVMLYPFLTVEAVGQAVERIRNACADRGRDPNSIHICHPIVVAPELDDFTTRAYAHARAVTYLEWPGHGEALTDSNGWDRDRSVLTRLRAHKQLVGKNADQDFHRAELLEPAGLVPDEWMEESCAIGTVEHCVDRLAEYRAVGVDEVALYAATPNQCKGLIETWRSRAATRDGVPV